VKEERRTVSGRPEAKSRNRLGRGRRSPDEARDARRARLLEAAVAVLGESGVTGATAAAVSAYAGLSRSSFYEIFQNIEQCLLAAYRQQLGRLTEVISTAFAAEATWDRGVVAGLAALVALIDAEPQLSRVLLVQAPALGEAIQEQRQQALRDLHRLLDTEGEYAAANGAHVLRAEAAIGAVAEVLRARVSNKQPAPCTPLLAELVEVVLVQYETSLERRGAARGWAAAIIEERAAQPPPPAKTPPRLAGKFPINERAFRMNDVILYLEASPGASNQEVAKGIGVSHEGQISKLLARLQELGLLRKRAGGAGHANAWWLTPAGERYAQTLQEEAT
jgi:AcrR family transcriptional regulator